MPDNPEPEYNADELEAPSWLNAAFIEGVLRSYEKVPDLKVTDLKISPASAQGDHYASIMFRTMAEYTTSKGTFTKSLILKTMPEQEGHKKEMLNDSHLFETEIGMYSKVMPEFERILREAGDNTKLYVPCVYYSLKPRSVLIFEDLVPQGYAIIRDRPAKPEEQKAVYEKLAKWHAVSMKLMNEQPEFLKDFRYGMMEMKTLMVDPMVTSGIGNFMEMLDKIPELTKYKVYFEKIQDYYLTRVGEVMQEYRNSPQPAGHYILCHGDFHLRNMMFRNNKESGEFEDVMFVDFQICNLSPSSVDLIYSIYLLLEPEQREELGKGLINHYISVLLETLKKINYKGKLPTQAGLWKQIHRHKFYDFFLISTFLPMILAIKANALKMPDLIQKEESRKEAYTLEGFQKEVKKLLPKFEELGYFKDI
ncbi:hypothetical protein KR018_000664 [Drosophila ironensis]|nr:hypothetical protein KR018_000664 [Drosophila ironensis]